ncbi:cytochrome P450 [Streptomyces sp. NPDC003077]|uniref:cytochrome P450 family protein n=1 Tax=Streptomyces sp. NPDC003077 TaxID=3154443 RepID=UPI0033A8A807
MSTSAPLDSPEYFRDPYPTLAALRRRGPVQRVRTGPFGDTWAVTGWSEARAAFADPRLSKDTTRYFADKPRTRDLAPAVSATMLATDPPDHTRLRRLAMKAFTPAAVARLEPRIAALADRLIQTMADRGTADLIEDFAVPLPIDVIGELLGVPPEDRATLRRLSNALFATGDKAAVDAASHAISDYMTALIATKRAALSTEEGPADAPDLLTALITVRDENGNGNAADGNADGRAATNGNADGNAPTNGHALTHEEPETGEANGRTTPAPPPHRLSEPELVSLAVLLVVAGHETTTNLIGNGMLALLQDDALRARVRENPELLPSVIEELLRYDAPLTTATFRYATTPLTLGGVDIKAGDVVLVLPGAANRDPSRFPDPDVLQLDRPTSHLSFGHGIHHCLGAPLARLEARIAFQALLTRFPGLRLACPADELPWRHTRLVRGLAHLPVTWTRPAH